MAVHRRFWICAGGLVLAASLWVSCTTVERTVTAPPHIEGATFVGNRACADCHTNIARIFPASPHARYYKEDDLARAATSGCESCHGPGSRHAAAGGGRGRFIVNPRKEPTVCFDCHLETHAEFRLPERHPVLEGKVTCVDCHDPHGREILKPAGGLAMARLNESCSGCHREQSRLFVFEHEAMREGCTSCHAPHGTVNARLLHERDANLCLKCHAQVQTAAGQVLIGMRDHASYLRMGTCWSAGCHTAVHGSNVSPKMLY